MKLLRAFLICYLPVLSIGCAITGSSSSPSLFLLDDAPDNSAASSATAAHGADRPVLHLAAVQVAPYLDQGGIVYQTAAHRVVVANNNRWASPLAGQLTGGLYTRLSDDLTKLNVERGNAAGAGYVLRTYVDSFLGHYDGSAHVSGRWALLDADGKTVLREQFSRRVELGKNGYPALVSSLARGWQQVADGLALRIHSALRRDESAAR